MAGKRVSFERDVLGAFGRQRRLSAEVKAVAQENLHKWTWSCEMCLRDLVWADFSLTEAGWPAAVCNECIEATGSDESPDAARSQKAAVRTLRKLSQNNSLCPYALEKLATTVMVHCGGINGFARLVKRMLKNTPVGLRNRLDLLVAAIRCKQAAEELKHEQALAEEAYERTRHKSLKGISDEDLRALLRPMLVDLLKRHPALGVKALKESGWLVAHKGPDLVRQMKSLSPRKRSYLLGALWDEFGPQTSDS